jgi:NitT/TauT family transport system permease protein
VAEEFAAAVTSSEFYSALAETLRRVVLTWAGAYVAALIIGIAMARNWVFETIAHPWVFVGLALPGPVSILFAILVLGLGETTSLVALWVAVTPFIVTFVYDGSRALDPKLFQMAGVYGMSAGDRLRHVILPQLAPALLSGARFGFAMAWKLVVLVEALSATNGIGERLEYFFSFNQPAAVIAWTLSFTVVMILAELFVFRTASRRLFRWRPVAAS